MFLNLTVSNVLNPSICCILIEIMLESFTIFHRPGRQAKAQGTAVAPSSTLLKPSVLSGSKVETKKNIQKRWEIGKSDMTVNSYQSHEWEWSPVPAAGAFLRTLPLVWRSVKAA